MSFIERYRVNPGDAAGLASRDPSDTAGLEKKEAVARLARVKERIAELQYTMWGERKHALLIALQAMDAGGKDGTIRRVFSGINPEGVRVTSFKRPTEEELAHDFLWRVHNAVPTLGEIGIFNRSHYEDVLIGRVESLVPESVWAPRYEQINMFEKLITAPLSAGGRGQVTMLKFFLHTSKAEQRERLIERIHDPRKNWKFEHEDIDKRKHWDAYLDAYEIALTECSTEHAPWFVIPGNRKWARDLIVAEIVCETLESLDMQLSKVHVEADALERLILDTEPVEGEADVSVAEVES